MSDFEYVQQILQDYADILWTDKEVADNLMYLLGRFMMTGEDINDEEMAILKEFVQERVNKYVKERAN